MDSFDGSLGGRARSSGPIAGAAEEEDGRQSEAKYSG